MDTRKKRERVMFWFRHSVFAHSTWRDFVDDGKEGVSFETPQAPPRSWTKPGISGLARTRQSSSRWERWLTLRSSLKINYAAIQLRSKALAPWRRTRLREGVLLRGRSRDFDSLLATTRGLQLVEHTLNLQLVEHLAGREPMMRPECNSFLSFNGVEYLRRRQLRHSSKTRGKSKRS